jgi:recombination protein U
MAGLKGKDLEKRANKANIQYRKKKDALILQIPVPLILTSKGVIPKESTVDFAGLISGGRFIAYDTKETMSETSFPLSNIKQHQFLYLELVNDLGGVAFFLIHFKSLYKDQAFYTPISLVSKYWYEHNRKSIPITDFKKLWLVDIDDYLTQLIKKQLWITKN